MKKFFSAKELAIRVGDIPKGRVLPLGTHAFGLSEGTKEVRAEKNDRHLRNREVHGATCRAHHEEAKGVSLDNQCGLPYGSHKEWEALKERLDLQNAL